MRKAQIWLIVLAMLVTGCTKKEGAERLSAAQSRIDLLQEELSRDAVGRIDIVHISDGAESPIRVSPDMLEKNFQYKIVIRDARHGIDGPGLQKSVRDTFVQMSSDGGDLRWGLTFFNLTGRPIVSIYLDSSGERGFVGSQTVTFNRSLGNWIRRNFHGVLN